MNASPAAQSNTSPQEAKTLKTAGICGMGFYVPERVLTNDDLAALGLDTNDEWVRSRTGIRERHIVAPDESTVDIAEKAARAALQDAGIAPDELDLIVVATCTPDYQFPSTASLLQFRLQSPAAAFDMGAACSGFVYALVTAAQFIATGAYRTILVVGAEAMSRIVNWNDRNTAVLFGDGAGAVVLRAAAPNRGLIGFDLGSDGSGAQLLKIPIDAEPTACCGPDDLKNGAQSTAEMSSEPRRKIFQNGREVYRFAVTVMGESASRALQNCGVASEDVSLFVPHQANIRIIEAAAKRIKVPPGRVFVNVDRYGNTSAASVPIALCEARDAGRIRAGDTIVMVGFGAGLTWASAVVKW